MKTDQRRTGFLNMSSLFQAALDMLRRPGTEVAEGIEEAHGLLLSPLRIPQLFALLRDKSLHLSGWVKESVTIVEITKSRRDDDDGRVYFSTKQVVTLLQTTCITKDEPIGDGEFRLTFKKQI